MIITRGGRNNSLTQIVALVEQAHNVEHWPRALNHHRAVPARPVRRPESYGAVLVHELAEALVMLKEGWNGMAKMVREGGLELPSA